MFTLYIYDSELKQIAAEVVAETKEFCEEAAINYGYDENITGSKYKWTYQSNEENNSTAAKLIDARVYRTEKIQYCINVLDRLIQKSKGDNSIILSEDDIRTLQALDFGWGDPDLSPEDVIKFRDILADRAIGKLLRQQILPEMSLTPQEYLDLLNENTENSKNIAQVIANKVDELQQKIIQNIIPSIDKKSEDISDEKTEKWIVRVAVLVFLTSVYMVYSYGDNLWIAIPFAILWLLSVLVLILFKPDAAGVIG